MISILRHGTTLLVLLATTWPAQSAFTPQRIALPYTGNRKSARHFQQVRRSKKREEDDSLNNPGMEDAFRQLDELKSLDEEDDIPQDSNKPRKKIDASTALDDAKLGDVAVSPEKEIQVYKGMVEELEQNEDAEAYSELLSDLGASQKQTDDTYSQVIVDLGGNPSQKETPPPKDESPSTPTISLNDASTDQFMEEAMAEALKEVKINNPRLSDSILDDKEIMKEIEGIFEQGNEKLLSSLEEIRVEQENLAKASAAKTAQAAMDNIEDEAVRLRNAEKSKEMIMKRVASETAIVQQAAAELEKANAEIEKDFLVTLKSGGIPKQLAFVGLILFSGRSIFDSIGSVGGDESLLMPALVQGAIAVLCALAFFFL